MSDFKFPVDFDKKVKEAPSANGTGYPYRISASDLMADFTYAALTGSKDWIEEGTEGSYLGRKLKLPDFPDGTSVFLLGLQGGELKWIEDTGGGASGTFLASFIEEVQGEGENKQTVIVGVKVTSGSYHILNTNTDVSETTHESSADYVYAIIEHSNAGIFKEFKIEVSTTVKDPTNLDPTGKFVQFSNILLAEGMVVGGKRVMVQRRVGNLSLVHQVVSGHICLWAYSTGGNAVPPVATGGTAL